MQPGTWLTPPRSTSFHFLDSLSSVVHAPTLVYASHRPLIRPGCLTRCRPSSPWTGRLCRPPARFPPLVCLPLSRALTPRIFFNVFCPPSPSCLVLLSLPCRSVPFL